MSPKDSSSHTPLAEREVLTIIAGVLLAVFLASLDQTIVATALPTIAAEFQDVDHLSWIMSGYLLAATISTPIYGKLGDLYGRRTLLTTAIAFFVVASVLSALAGSMGHLVAARAIQGVGAGGLMTLAAVLLGALLNWKVLLFPGTLIPLNALLFLWADWISRPRTSS